MDELSNMSPYQLQLYNTKLLNEIKDHLIKKDEPESVPEGDPGLEKFNRIRWYYFIILAVLLFGITVFFYMLNSIIFLLPAGFFVATLGILFMLIVDVKLTKGDTFATIFKSPVALSIVILSIAVFFGIGVNIGQQYVPESFGNEANLGDSQSIEQLREQIGDINSRVGTLESVPSVPDDKPPGDKGIPNR